MATMSVSENDFTAAAIAAQDALSNGDDAQAKALDKIARKMNAALSSENAPKVSGHRKTVRWQDMPSTLTHE